MVFIHFKLNLSLYDDNKIYDNYGSYTSFNISDKYLKYIINGQTAKKVLTLLKLPIDMYEVFNSCQGSCVCEFKKLELANLNDKIDEIYKKTNHPVDNRRDNI